jgi:hypothetical protein
MPCPADYNREKVSEEIQEAKEFYHDAENLRTTRREDLKNTGATKHSGLDAITG